MTSPATCPHCARTVRVYGGYTRHVKVCSKRPPPDELAAIYEAEGSVVRVGKRLGVSDHTVRKWLREDGTRVAGRSRQREGKAPWHRHLMQHVWRRQFKPVHSEADGCDNCPALALCDSLVPFGLVACETPDTVQCWHLSRRGISLREVAQESGGLLG